MKKIFFILFGFVSLSIAAQDNAFGSKSTAITNDNKNTIEVKDQSHVSKPAMFDTKKVKVVVDSINRNTQKEKQPVTQPSSSFTRKETYPEK